MEGPIEEDSIGETNVISKDCNSAHRAKANNRTSSAASVAVSSGQLIKTANGQTVVLTGPITSTISSVSSAASGIGSNSTSSSHHHPNANKSVPTVAQAIVSGGMSIVQLHLPNQSSNMVQSVIQPNHQSVIQAPNTAAISTLFPKNVILLNKPVGQGSVIQSTESDHGIHVSLQNHTHVPRLTNLPQLIKEDNDAVSQAMFDEDARKRREILARRPSYRKILSDLSATEGSSSDNKSDDGREPSIPTSISIPANYLKTISLPASALQLGSHDGTLQGIPTIMTNTATSGSTIVQYATSGHEGQFIVPDLQTYQLRAPNQSGIAQNVVMTSTNLTPQIIDEASKKRELRLLKNREAAKECRRKKKEYIKCLENRVAVLENQNKALIDELKTLKELYCKKSE